MISFSSQRRIFHEVKVTHISWTLEMSSLINKSRKEYSLKYFMAFKAEISSSFADSLDIRAMYIDFN